MKKNCRCDTRLHFFSQRVITRSNSSSQEDVDSPFINSFKDRLEKRRVRQVDFFKVLQVPSLYPAARWNDKVHVGLDRDSPRQVQPHLFLFCSCSLAVLDPRVGHTMDVLSPFIPVLCHSD